MDAAENARAGWPSRLGRANLSEEREVQVGGALGHRVSAPRAASTGLK